jgi:hypothetical protein
MEAHVPQPLAERLIDATQGIDKRQSIAPLIQAAADIAIAARSA